MSKQPNPESSNQSEDDVEYKITNEDVERSELQIDVPEFDRTGSYVKQPDQSSMSHFAFGYGDDNPLWHDSDYAAKTRWRDQIAPPLYFMSVGINETPKYNAETKALMRGLFRGVGKYYSGVNWEWYAPLYAGNKVFKHRSKSESVTKQSSFTGNRTVKETYRQIWFGADADIYAVNYESYISAERGASKKTGKYADVKRQTYTPEDIAEIDKCYAAEQLRGSETRYWEDVEIGDTLTPLAKGPLGVVDIISQHMGFGWGGYGVGPLRYGWKKRQKMPAFYVEDKYGVPDIVQRLHWDEERAQALGLPAPYDYGMMRSCWMSHHVTNWMGDDAWLWKLNTELRGFNFLGDWHICEGEIISKKREGEHCIVEAALTATNQRGTETTKGTALIILPSREYGPVMLPTPPVDLARRVAKSHCEAADRLRAK